MSLHSDKNVERLARLKKRLPVLIVAGGVAAVLLLVVALPARERDKPPTEPPPVNVRVRDVEPVASLDDLTTLHGIVEPNRTVQVAAEVSGQIRQYAQRRTTLTRGGRTFPAGQPLAEGEPVESGDPIVLLDTDLLQAEYDRAEAQAEYDARDYERKTDLFAKNVATKAEVDQAKTAMEVSRAALATARLRLERAVIAAPISGILNRLPEEIGQYVQVGTCVAEIVDIDVAKIVADVPEKDVHYLGTGEPAEILIDPLGGRAVDGTITFIGELADERTRTTPIEISVSNEHRLLRSGQIVTVRLNRQTLRDVIMVPLEAVIPLEAGRVVYVVEDGLAQRREVELGFMKGAAVQVLGGLRAGDRLIVSGQRYVGPGQAVREISPDGEASDPAPQAEATSRPAGDASAPADLSAGQE